MKSSEKFYDYDFEETLIEYLKTDFYSIFRDFRRLNP